MVEVVDEMPTEGLDRMMNLLMILIVILSQDVEKAKHLQTENVKVAKVVVVPKNVVVNGRIVKKKQKKRRMKNIMIMNRLKMKSRADVLAKNQQNHQQNNLLGNGVLKKVKKKRVKR